MSDVAIKFVYSGGEITFGAKEVLAETLQYLQDIAVNVSQSQAPSIYYHGAEYNVISLRIDEVDAATAAKVAALRAVDYELDFYYMFAADGGAASLKVIPMVDDDEEVIEYGQMATGVYHEIKFLVSG